MPVNTRSYCKQHHQPLSECAPWSRHNHSNRFREDDWQATEDIAEAADLLTTTLIAHSMEVMRGYLRCHRGDCGADGPPVPVMFGDLTGKTPGEWIAEAANLAVSQHPNHEPVWIGVPPPALAPVVLMPPMPAATPDHRAKKGRARA